jgi:predicted porin
MDAIHLHQQAEQSALTLHAAWVTAQGAAAAPNGINLVNENDAGGLLTGGVKQAVHTRSSNTCKARTSM